MTERNRGEDRIRNLGGFGEGANALPLRDRVCEEGLAQIDREHFKSIIDFGIKVRKAVCDDLESTNGQIVIHDKSKASEPYIEISAEVKADRSLELICSKKNRPGIVIENKIFDEVRVHMQSTGLDLENDTFSSITVNAKAFDREVEYAFDFDNFAQDLYPEQVEFVENLLVVLEQDFFETLHFSRRKILERPSTSSLDY